MNAPTTSSAIPPRVTRRLRPILVAGLSVLGFCAASCGSDETVTREAPNVKLVNLNNPTRAGAMAPSLAATTAGVALTWLEPADTRTTGGAGTTTAVGAEGDMEHGADQAPKVWRQRMSLLRSGVFTPVETIAESDKFFANWADLPGVVQHPAGSLVAHHLEKIGLDTYAYGVFLSSTNADARITSSWDDRGLLHDDRSGTEHGFVSYARDGAALRAFWLDGRQMANDGPMSLRTAVLEAEMIIEAQTAGIRMSSTVMQPPSASEVLDDRVCECCQTDAAWTTQGPVVVYRDRTEEEIRDISIVRKTADGWTAPKTIHNDGWGIKGCPVNGPAVAAHGDLVAVAWFTGAERTPRVKVAISRDAGATFEDPILLQDGDSSGRVDVAMAVAADNPANVDVFVAHLSRRDTPKLLLEQLTVKKGAVDRHESRVIAESSEARSSGFPRMAHDGQSLFITWVGAEEPSRVHTAVLGAVGN